MFVFIPSGGDSGNSCQADQVAYEFDLFEDDGISYESKSCTTRFSQRAREGGRSLVFEIHPQSGEYDHLPEERTFKINFVGVPCGAKPISILIDGGSVSEFHYNHNNNKDTLTISGKSAGLCLKKGQHLQIEIDLGRSSSSPRDRVEEKLLEMIGKFHLDSSVKAVLAENLDGILADPNFLEPFQVAMTKEQSRAIIEVVHQVGFEELSNAFPDKRFLLWNNRPERTPGFKWRFSSWDKWKAFDLAKSSQSGPRFQVFEPEKNSKKDCKWSLRILCFDICEFEFHGDKIAERTEHYITAQ